MSTAMPEQLPRPDGGILIVEDHRRTMDLLLYLLGNAFPGQAMRTANSAEEALASCRIALPRLVVMDIRLPGISGIDAARQIKALSPAVRVVMHSNHDHAIFREQCAAAGADAFVSKTQSHAELVPAVTLLLSQTVIPASAAGKSR